jgi:predicted  nucleic acid-binding Zn-ribbon protein
MTNFVIKDDIFFTLEKSEGNMDFPRKFFARKVSGTEIKIRTLGSNEALLVDVWHLDNFTIDGVSFTDVHEAVTALQTILWNEATSTPPLGEDCETPVHTKDCDREALIEMLQTQLDELIKIYGAVDGLELTTENIRIEAGQINLSTDEVEALLTQIKDLIALKGSDCANATFTKDCDRQDLLDAIGAVVTALNTNSQAEQALLTSIDTKLDELESIKAELVTANTTLTNIKTDTAQINTNLEVVIEKLDLQVTALEDLKVLVTETNTQLTTANATLVTISTDIATIKTDIGLIKTDISEIKTDVKTIITKLDAVVTSLTNIETKLDTVVTELQTINTTLQTEFDQTQVKLDEVITAIEFAHDTFQLEDCEGNPIGVEENVIKVVQLAKQRVSICNVQELADAINAGATPPIDYTALLTDIKTNTANLEAIKTATESSLAQLQTANTTLTGIKTDTTAISTNTAETVTKLTDLLVKIDAQLVLLGDIKALITTGNATLVEIKDKLTEIDTAIDAIGLDIATIKADIGTIKADISEIKTDVKTIIAKLDLVLTALASIDTLLTSIDTKLTATNSLLQSLLDELDIELVINTFEKNNGTINYVQRDTILWDSENSVQISKLTEYSINGIDWTTTAPVGNVNLGFITASVNTYAQDTFQLENCDGTPIGVEEEVIKVVQIAKQVAKICNTDDITAPIVEAIELANAVGKRNDLISLQASVGDEFTLASVFTTVSMFASKGEFKIEAINDFSADVTKTGGTVFSFIELSNDGIGTATGSTDVPQSLDTRANSKDLEAVNNSYKITCVRAGVIQLELYK